MSASDSRTGLPPAPWKPCRSHEDENGPMYEIEPEDQPSYDARPFVKIVAADGSTVVTAHDLFEFDPGVAEAIAALPAMVEALGEWKCPACGGRGRVTLYGPGRQRAARDPGYRTPWQHEAACRKCGGNGLDPRAAAALRAAGLDKPAGPG